LLSSEEEKEKQQKYEKLIDWEVNKQLTWFILFLTLFLGLIQLLGLPFWNLSKTVELALPFFTIRTSAQFPFILIYALLVAGLDVSIYRLGTTFERIRRWELQLRALNTVMKAELSDKAYPLRLFYGIFLNRLCENEVTLRKWLVALIIIFFDVLLALMLLARVPASS